MEIGGDGVVGVQDQIDHDLRHLGGHAKADLEAAICHEMPGAAGPGAKQGGAGLGAGAQSGPAVDDRGLAQGGDGGAGAGDEGVKLGVGAGRVGPVVFRGRADGDGTIGMGDDVEGVDEQLRQVGGVVAEESGVTPRSEFS